MRLPWTRRPAASAPAQPFRRCPPPSPAADALARSVDEWADRWDVTHERAHALVSELVVAVLLAHNGQDVEPVRSGLPLAAREELVDLLRG